MLFDVNHTLLSIKAVTHQALTDTVFGSEDQNQKDLSLPFSICFIFISPILVFSSLSGSAGSNERHVRLSREHSH